MQAFIKGKKRGGMQEATRQVLNRAIDLLHRVSNKKVSEEIALRELTADLSTHFLAEEGGQARLQVILQEVTRIVSQLDLGQIPLYEAIMMVNRLVVQEVKTQDTFVNQEFDRPGNTLHEIPVQEKKEPPMEELSVLMNRVVLNKKQLEESIMVLNGSLQAIGFELRSIKD